MREFYDRVKAEYLDGLKKHESRIQAWRENHMLSDLWKDVGLMSHVMPIIPMQQEALIDFTEKQLVELYRLAMAELPKAQSPQTAAILAVCKSVAVELDRRGKGGLLGLVEIKGGKNTGQGTNGGEVSYKPAFGAELRALEQLERLANDFVRVIVLEKSGERDGDGFWHGSDAFGSNWDHLQKAMGEYETVMWIRRLDADQTDADDESPLS